MNATRSALQFGHLRADGRTPETIAAQIRQFPGVVGCWLADAQRIDRPPHDHVWVTCRDSETAARVAEALNIRPMPERRNRYAGRIGLVGIRIESGS